MFVIFVHQFFAFDIVLFYYTKKSRMRKLRNGREMTMIAVMMKKSNQMIVVELPHHSLNRGSENI